VIGAQEDEKSALGKKALEQLRYFVEDLKDASYRTLQLDSEGIPILTNFLRSCEESKQIAILCSLDWLNHFIDFFREDFLSQLDKLRSQHRANNVSAAGTLGILEESKEADSQIVEEDINGLGVSSKLLTIDTGAHGQADPTQFDINDLRKNKALYLDAPTKELLKGMYRQQFPDIISTILRLKHSKKITDIDCKRLVENINGRFLRTVIQILSERDEFEQIFHRLKKEYEQVQRQGGEKQEAIIQWYTELFKEFSNDLIEQHQDVFQGLIVNLNFENSRLVKRIMLLVCMMSTKNGDYSRKVMSQLIERFHIIRSQPKFDDKIKQVI